MCYTSLTPVPHALGIAGKCSLKTTSTRWCRRLRKKAPRGTPRALHKCLPLPRTPRVQAPHPIRVPSARPAGVTQCGSVRSCEESAQLACAHSCTTTWFLSESETQKNNENGVVDESVQGSNHAHKTAPTACDVHTEFESSVGPHLVCTRVTLCSGCLQWLMRTHSFPTCHPASSQGTLFSSARDQRTPISRPCLRRTSCVASKTAHTSSLCWMGSQLATREQHGFYSWEGGCFLGCPVWKNTSREKLSSSAVGTAHAATAPSTALHQSSAPSKRNRSHQSVAAGTVTAAPLASPRKKPFQTRHCKMPPLQLGDPAQANLAHTLADNPGR